MNKITTEEFVHMYVKAWFSLDYDSFVTHILKATPRSGDAWQEEKFELFQSGALKLSQMNVEHIENIVNYIQQFGSIEGY